MDPSCSVAFVLASPLRPFWNPSVLCLVEIAVVQGCVNVAMTE